MNEAALKLLNRSSEGALTIPGADGFSTPEEGWLSLQSILGLAPGCGVLHVRLAISALEAFPDMLGVVGETHRTYEEALYGTPRLTLPSGFHLQPDEDGSPPEFNRDALEWPVVTTMTVRFNTGSNARVELPGVRSANIQYQTVNGVFYPEWPEWTGVRGGVVASKDVTHTIYHEPFSVSYRIPVESARNNAHVPNWVLGNPETAEYFRHALGDHGGLEAFAGLCMVLALSNRYVKPHGYQ